MAADSDTTRSPADPAVGLGLLVVWLESTTALAWTRVEKWEGADSRAAADEATYQRGKAAAFSEVLDKIKALI